MDNKIIIGSAQFGTKYSLNNKKVLKSDECEKIFRKCKINKIKFLDTAFDYLEANSFATVYLTGKNFYNARTTNSNIHTFETFKDLKAEIERKNFSENLILIKGSRGMALERILELL